MNELIQEELDLIDKMTEHFTRMKFSCDNTVFRQMNEAQAELVGAIMDLYVLKRNFYRKMI